MNFPLPVMLGEEAGVPLAVDLMVILLVSAIVATIFARLKLESIPGFLIAGVLLGPESFGVIRHAHTVEQISDLAVILLMFNIGLHLDVGHMGRGMVHILGIGVVSTLAMIGLSFPVMLMCGMPAPAALVVAMALSMSSTAVFVRIVAARRELRSVHSRVGLGVAIVQDLAAVVILALLPPIAKWAGVETTGLAEQSGLFHGLPAWAEFLAQAGVSIGGIAFLLTVGRFGLPLALRAVASTGSGELMLVLTGAIALGGAIGTKLLGFSPEMGAFLSGFLLASTPFRHQLAGQFAPIRDILMAVFFTAVGLKVNPQMVANDWWIVLLAIGGVMVLKIGTLWGAAWSLGMTARSGLLTAVYLGNVGEFAIVVLGTASTLHILSPQTNSDVIAVVIASLVISPMLVVPAHDIGEKLAHWPLARWMKSQSLRDGPEGPEGKNTEHSEMSGHVVVAGFGPVGRALADHLEVAEVPVTVIELNPRTVERQTRLTWRRIVYGDVTNPEVLESAGVRRAKAIVITVPDDEASLRAVLAARALAPHAFIAVRSAFLSGAFKAMQLGADHVTVEEVATAEAMQREVLAALRRRDQSQPST